MWCPNIFLIEYKSNEACIKWKLTLPHCSWRMNRFHNHLTRCPQISKYMHSSLTDSSLKYLWCPNICLSIQDSIRFPNICVLVNWCIFVQVWQQDKPHDQVIWIHFKILKKIIISERKRWCLLDPIFSRQSQSQFLTMVGTLVSVLYSAVHCFEQ